MKKATLWLTLVCMILAVACVPVAAINALPEDDFSGTIVAATSDGAVFSTLDEAIYAAADVDTVTLLADAAYTGPLVITDGLTIDLNGNTLTADYVAVFGGGAIVDSSADNTGLLVCAQNRTVIETSTTATAEGVAAVQLPIWDASQGGFVFGQFAFRGLTVALETQEATEEGVDPVSYLAYRVAFMTEKGVRDLLSDGGSDNGIDLVIRLSWTKDGNTYHEDVYLGDALLGEIVAANGNSQATLTLVDYEALENLSFSAMVLANGNVLAASDAVSYLPAAE